MEPQPVLVSLKSKSGVFDGLAVEVEVPSGLHVNLDGEPTHATHHRFDIEPQRLKLHLPESTELLSR